MPSRLGVRVITLICCDAPGRHCTRGVFPLGTQSPGKAEVYYEVTVLVQAGRVFSDSPDFGQPGGVESSRVRLPLFFIFFSLCLVCPRWMLWPWVPRLLLEFLARFLLGLG